MNRITITALALALAVGGAWAQTQTPNIDKRQERQQKRIGQGLKTGELNAREAARLERKEARIQKMEQKAKSDGVVTKGERTRIQHKLNKTSRQIYREKHDAQKAK